MMYLLIEVQLQYHFIRVKEGLVRLIMLLSYKALNYSNSPHCPFCAGPKNKRKESREKKHRDRKVVKRVQLVQLGANSQVN